ncbi:MULTISPECIES: cation:proton antiporter [unclassified Isoptericola]|uniref:cation:proton antiporter domain-containing protein n=1 Tax=unclassified Isoptericola TaxID=2623355 RepID=UPI0027128A59|nr:MULTISPECIES: cation:proton antiporter [unclassified Isoptericola]MDO8147147.1 cation:proton antiporter [Isoptericola sp. b515]MDO8150538.1 cation:proton antiporter [Isoptericola sp. b408]
MGIEVLAPFAVLVLAWALVSGALQRREVTGPLVFVAAGALLANDAWGPFPVNIETASVHTLAEITLALVLFADAARINLRNLRRNATLPLRLLLVGFPLTLLLGFGAAVLILADLPWELALLVAAALAPTDAALSAQVIGDRRVPGRLRVAVNVESGLNDGVVTPVVTLAIALAGITLGVGSLERTGVAGALLELGLGVSVGGGIGLLGAWGVTLSARRGWAEPGALPIGTLATGVGAFAVSLSVSGNGFVAAFVGGLVFGLVVDREQGDEHELTELTELGGELMTFVVWFLFGAALVPIAIEQLSVATVGYALLSLTVVRMLPVVLAMTGTGLASRDVLFLGWFGPRGLASVVFALLAVESLGESEPVLSAVATITTTVMLSVLLHGASAGPVAARYGMLDEMHVRGRSSKLGPPRGRVGHGR